MKRRRITEFTGDPWDGVEMPDGFDPEKNEFLRTDGRGKSRVTVRLLDLDDLRGEEKKNVKYWRATYGPNFASMADYHIVLRALASHSGAPEFINEQKARLRESHAGRIMIANTMISLEGDKTYVRNNYDGTSWAVERDIAFPRYRGRILSEVLSEEEGLLFMRTLFGTPEGPDVIANDLESVFELKADKDISVSTPEKDWLDPKKDGLNTPCSCSFRYDPTAGTLGISCMDHIFGIAGHAYPLKNIPVTEKK